MPTLIKNRQVAENIWQHADETTVASLPGKIIVSLRVFANNAETLAERFAKGDIALKLESDQNIDELPENCSICPMIAIDFPKFTDGRGYTLARELRTVKHYKGEIRAVGDVLHDQLNAMERCGFDAFELADGKDAQKALTAFNDFSKKYQKDLLENKPVYQRA